MKSLLLVLNACCTFGASNATEEIFRGVVNEVIDGNTIVMVTPDKDRLGNRLGEIRIDGASDPRYELVKAGLAWTSEKEPIPELELLKEEAREKNIGLWKEENPIPPWVFRRQQSMMESKSS